MRNQFMLGASLVAVMTAASPAALAQDSDNELGDIEEVLITGSRRAARSASDTPAPVDVITGDQFTNQSNGDLSSLLRNVVPSYNVNSQPINDAATLVRPANLRGLAPDQTLVLVNGKRRHRAGVITFLGSGLSDGAQGADISSIPALALKQVDVLRDGAAAQYGSDAIAGVINFKLNDAAEGGTIEAKYASTYEGDGDALQISANFGMPIGDNGFVNITGEYRELDPTSRSVQRPDAPEQAEFFRDPAQIWGLPEVEDDIKIVVNSAFEFSEQAEVYLFGNYAERTVTGGFYFRNPDTRGGVFSDGTGRLVGDLTPDLSGNCPQSVDPSDTDAYNALLNDPNCFIFNEMFPGGFTPNFGGDLEDLSMVAGVRGEAGGWGYDLSWSYGENEVAYFIFNTVNASLGPNTPTSFRPGTDEQRETNVNLDVVKGFDVGLASELNVALGMEWREEEFSRVAGDSASYRRGPLFGIGYGRGFSSGSNGFNGFPPSSAGTWKRTNWAAYLDMEADVTDQLVLGGAIRWEDFSTFGSTVNGKISMLYRVSDSFKLRGTASTGFRAPSPGQANVTSVSTSIDENGLLVDEGLVPPTSLIALAVGADNNIDAGELGEEKSKSLSIGGAWDMDSGASLTIDVFHIEVDDRISVSDSVPLTAEEALGYENQGIPGAANFRGVQWFQNAFDTRTQGIDVVYNQPLEMTEGGTTNFILSANYTKTKVTAGSIGGSIREDLLENALPNFRANGTLTHQEENWRGLMRINYHGAGMEYFAGFLRHEFGGEFNVDLEFAYNAMENLELIAGVENLFDNYADELPQGGNDFGAVYPESGPFGINGGVYYAKVRFTF